MSWMIFQLVTVLVVLAFGIVLGCIWEARTKMRSKHRVMSWDAEPELASSHVDMSTPAVRMSRQVSEAA